MMILQQPVNNKRYGRVGLAWIIIYFHCRDHFMAQKHPMYIQWLRNTVFQGKVAGLAVTAGVKKLYQHEQGSQ